MENNVKEYDGFSTPSFICEGSDSEKRGDIYDQYSTLPNGSKLIVGKWTVGFQDGLIHIWLMKPITTLCEEREKWAGERTLLKEPIGYDGILKTEEIKPKPILIPKKKMVYDKETKQFRMI